MRVEREPITDANVDAAMDGPAISEEEHEVVLHEEEPVVEKRAVPKERVRLDTETHTEEREVSEDVRREEIESTTARASAGKPLKRAARPQAGAPPLEDERSEDSTPGLQRGARPRANRA